MILWDLMFDALFHRAPAWLQWAVTAFFGVIIVGVLWWAWQDGSLKL